MPLGSPLNVAIEVVFAPEAQADLIQIYDYVARHGGHDRALAYAEKIEAACRRLANFPHRGLRRDDIRPGLLVVSFARRVTVGFSVDTTTVTIIRILTAGQDVTAALGEV
jgi:toxin ParE1/3/4